MADPDTALAPCCVCRATRQCSFCNGDGYVVERDRLTACGVCVTTGHCAMCGVESVERAP